MLQGKRFSPLVVIAVLIIFIPRGFFYQYNEAWIRWMPFCRCHFQIHYGEWESLHFGSNFSEVSSHRSNLTHWGWVTHICVSKLTIIGPDNGLSPGRHQAIIWTNAGILLIGPLGTNFSVKFNLNSKIFIQENALENVVCEMASILSRPQCVKINVNIGWGNALVPYRCQAITSTNGDIDP